MFIIPFSLLLCLFLNFLPKNNMYFLRGKNMQVAFSYPQVFGLDCLRLRLGICISGRFLADINAASPETTPAPPFPLPDSYSPIRALLFPGCLAQTTERSCYTCSYHASVELNYKCSSVRLFAYVYPPYNSVDSMNKDRGHHLPPVTSM